MCSCSLSGVGLCMEKIHLHLCNHTDVQIVMPIFVGCMKSFKKNAGANSKDYQNKGSNGWTKDFSFLIVFFNKLINVNLSNSR